MKGIVFTEFLDFVGQQFGDDMVDDMIAGSDLPHGGAYTSVGTYDHAEIVRMVVTLSGLSGAPVPDLVRAFGDNLAGVFARGFPDFFARCTHYFDFLQSIEEHIHVEVRKLYPEAELPRFETLERTEKRMVLRYSSPRHLDPLAEGLMIGTARQYGTAVRVSRDEQADEALGTVFVIDLA